MSTLFAILLLMNKKNPAYHHGHLRTALLKVATKMIAEQGIEGLTMRALSERIGVSRTAPYRHFSGKPALLAAVAAEGFKRLHRMMRAAMAQAGDDIPGQIEAMGGAYVQYAVENPTHYSLMFSCRAERNDRAPDFEAQGRDVFDLLVQTIAKGQAQAQIMPGEPLHLAYVAWASVHGLAALMIEAQVQAELDPQDLARFTAHTVVEGMRAR